MKNVLSKFMSVVKNSFKIYGRDVKNVAKNPIAIIIVLGLCILPSLYAWFNIVACWDPYGNTRGIKVAVVNEDVGYTLEGKNLNVGQMLVDELEQNEDIGWVFVDSEDAEYGLTHNKYYASLEIPKDFSKNLASVIAGEQVKPEIIYRVNEKSNAIAPKITDSGAKTVKNQVTTAFVKTVNEVVFDVFNTVGEDLDINKNKLLEGKRKILAINDKMNEIEGALDKAQEGTITLESFLEDVEKSLPEVEKAIKYLQEASGEGQHLITEGRADGNNALIELDKRLVEIQELNTEVQVFVMDARKDITNIDELRTKIPAILSKVEKIQSYIDPAIDVLQKLNNNNININQLLSDLIKQLKVADQAIQQQKEALEGLKEKLDGLEINPEIFIQLGNACKNANSVIDEQIKEIKQDGLDKEVELGKVLKQCKIVKMELAKRELDLTNIIQARDQLAEINKQYIGGYQSISLPQLLEALDEFIQEQNSDNRDQLSGAIAQTEKKTLYSQSNVVKTTQAAVAQLEDIQKINKEIIGVCDSIASGELTNEQLIAKIDQIIEKLDQLDKKIKKAIVTLEKVNGEININQWINDLDQLDNYITVKLSQFRGLPNRISQGVKVANDTLDLVSRTGNDISKAIDDGKQEYLTNIKPSLTIILDDVLAAGESLDEVLANADDALPKLNELVQLGKDAAKDGGEVVVTLQEKLPEIKKALGLVSAQLRQFSEEDLDDIIHLLENNPEEIGDFISSPVLLNEERVFHIPNYGSAMTPFYTALSLWVGCLILASVLTPRAKSWADGTEPGALEEYFGKLMTFMTLTIIQTLVVAFGNKYLLGVYMVDWPLFLGFSLYSTIIFTIIVYSLLSVFGNVGKAAAIILLVLQVAGAGGTFPVEVMPEFYQRLNPFLPFTYSIGALREAVGGPVMGNLVIDFWMLTIFGAVFLFFGILLKKPFRKLIHKSEEKFHDSGLAG